MKVFQPEVTSCRNKWCANRGYLPASGNEPQVAGCGSYGTMENQRLTTGGTSGRGVVPCEYGFLQKIPLDSTTYNQQSILYPYSGNNYKRLAASSIFDEANPPSYVPPTLQPRSLNRVGNEWRN